jgi:hyperosmotically inducible protein
VIRKMTSVLVFSSLFLAVACSNATKTETAEPSSNPPATSSTPPANTDADNTARNANNSTLAQTPAAQGENATDLQISAAIRMAVVDDKTLSVNAHNVKIITANGVVTLRGPVKSEEEKRKIEATAKQVAGVTRVDNLLEVEKNP